MELSVNTAKHFGVYLAWESIGVAVFKVKQKIWCFTGSSWVTEIVKTSFLSFPESPKLLESS